MSKSADVIELTSKQHSVHLHHFFFQTCLKSLRFFEPRHQTHFTMTVATEKLSSNHLTYETAGLTPSFSTTPGFFSAEFVALNPFDADFHDAAESPLHAEQSLDTPHTHYSSFSTEVPRSVLDATVQRNYDPSLPPTPGPRVSMSGLKVSTPNQLSSSRLLPTPEHSPTDVLNPTFLEQSNVEYPASYHLLPPASVGYSSSQCIHGKTKPSRGRSPFPG